MLKTVDDGRNGRVSVTFRGCDPAVFYVVRTNDVDDHFVLTLTDNHDVRDLNSEYWPVWTIEQTLIDSRFEQTVIGNFWRDFIMIDNHLKRLELVTIRRDFMYW